MTTISTSVQPLGYFVTLPEHIEDTFGFHFENLEKYEQYAMLATLSVYLANRQFEEWDGSMHDIYIQHIPGAVGGEVEELFPQLEQIEEGCNGTLMCLIEALVLNIHYTQVVE